MAREQSLPRRGLSADELVLDALLRDAPIGVVVLDRDLQIERSSRVAEADDADGAVERVVWMWSDAMPAGLLNGNRGRRFRSP